MTRIQKMILWSVAVGVFGYVGARLFAEAPRSAIAQVGIRKMHQQPARLDFLDLDYYSDELPSERPTEFLSKENSANDVLMVLKRETKPDVESTNDKENILGTWKVVSLQDSGRRGLPDHKVIFGKATVTFRAGDRTPSEESYELNLDQKPKWIDVTKRGWKMLGIYELNGDDLKICLNERAERVSPLVHGKTSRADDNAGTIGDGPDMQTPVETSGGGFKLDDTSAVKRLRDANSSEEKRAARQALRTVLTDIFTRDMQAREMQAREIEDRLAKLRQQYQEREKVKDKIIDLQLQVLEQDAAGLGFPGASSSSAGFPGASSSSAIAPGTAVPAPDSVPRGGR